MQSRRLFRGRQEYQLRIRPSRRSSYGSQAQRCHLLYQYHVTEFRAVQVSTTKVSNIHSSHSLMHPHFILSTTLTSVTYCSMHSLKTPPHCRLEGVLVADVLSVKLYPHDLMLSLLPSDTDIICTHPMFGPESGKETWKNLPFVYDVVRVAPDRKHVCQDFINMWQAEQCQMVPMPCSTHDTYAASTQFITHTTGT